MSMSNTLLLALFIIAIAILAFAAASFVVVS